MSLVRLALPAIFFLMLASRPAHAQYSVGVFGGVNFSGEDSKSTLESTSRAEPLFGVSCERSLNGSLALRASAKYIARGLSYPHIEFRDEANNYLGSGSAYGRVNYLVIDARVQGAIYNRQPSIYFAGGPSIEFPISAKMVDTYGGADHENTLDASKIYATVLSISLAMGASMDLSPAVSAFAEIAYSRSLTNVLRGPDAAFWTSHWIDIAPVLGVRMKLGD